MPLWPFARKKQRSSAVPAVEQEKAITPSYVPAFPRNATPRAPPTQPTDDEARPASSQRKRRRSLEKSRDIDAREDAPHATSEEATIGPRDNSIDQNITALPGVRKLERSPHLRPANLHSPAIPYNLDKPTPARLAMLDSEEAAKHKKGRPRPSKSNPATPQQRRTSKRQQKALREEEIRSMSAPVPIPKRPAGHGDMQRRDSKKARRAFSKGTSDSRGSNVSIPLHGSIHSSMSGVSDHRGWLVSGLDVFNPRPTVRLSGSLAPSSSFLGGHNLSRDGSKKEKLPALKEHAKRKDRRRVDHLADDLDSAELRVLMERESRRKDKKTFTDQEKLDRRLRKKAEKQRAEEDLRAPAMVTPPPSAIHPAFRTKDRYQEEGTPNVEAEMPTPVSLKDGRTFDDSPTAYRGRPSNYGAQREVEQDPFKDPEASPFADPESGRGRAGSAAEADSLLTTPVDNAPETPMEDPILGTAQAVRMSQSRLSHISISPPTSPLQLPEGLGAAAGSGSLSPLRREYTPDIPSMPSAIEERRRSDTSAKRAGTWAQFFRRGGAAQQSLEELSTSGPAFQSSFANTSRDSASRQQVPAHLVGTVSTRRSGTPVRTQSIFREDLPESPISPPDSRVQSPDLIAAGNVAAARRSKRAGDDQTHVPSFRASTPDLTFAGRTDSPVETERRSSAAVVPSSLASVDSEGSWLTGRPSKRKSNQSQLRSSAGSSAKVHKDFSASYEDLGMPEEEYFKRMAVDPESDARGEPSLPENQEDLDTDATPKRQYTNRRQPTLVKRDPAVKSREGLLTDYQAGEATVEETASETTSVSDYGDDQAEVSPHETAFFEQGRTVEYGRGHERHLSSGSAKLLDIPPSRTRSRRESPNTRTSIVSLPVTPGSPNFPSTPKL